MMSRWVKIICDEVLLIIFVELYFSFEILEIKPWGLILEFKKWRLNRGFKFITDLISYWIFGKQKWHCGMNQSVHGDMMFLASNSLHNLRAQNDHLQQIHWNEIFYRMYGLGLMLIMTTPKVHLVIQIVHSIDFLLRWLLVEIHVNKIRILIQELFQPIVVLLP